MEGIFVAIYKFYHQLSDDLKFAFGIILLIVSYKFIFLPIWRNVTKIDDLDNKIENTNEKLNELNEIVKQIIENNENIFSINSDNNIQIKDLASMIQNLEEKLYELENLIKELETKYSNKEIQQKYELLTKFNELEKSINEILVLLRPFVNTLKGL